MLSNLTVLMFAGLVAAGGAETTRPLVEDADLQSAGMFRYWQAHLPVSAGDSLGRAYRVDEALYVTSNHGVFFALTADTGLVRWAAKLAEADHRIYQPAHIRTADGTGPVVITTTTMVFVHDRFSGELIYRFAPPFAAGSSAVGYGGMLFMGSADGRFYSLQLALPEPFKRWAVLADGPVTTTPILYDRDMLLFAAQEGTVYSCAAADKTLNWWFRTGGPIMADVALDESGAYIASLNRSLYKVDLSSGSMAWRVRMPQPLTDGPSVTAHTVYQHCAGNGLSAIEADTGEERWRLPEGRTFVVHTRGGDLVLTDDSRLVVADHESGDVRHVIDAPAVAGAVSNTSDDAAYLLNSDGRVLCARLDSIPYLRRQQVIAARQRLHQPPRDEAKAIQEVRESNAGRSGSRLSDPLRSRRDARP